MILLLGMVCILAGCSSAHKEMVAEAEAALESGDFEDALKFYHRALEEKSDSSEVQDMIALLNDYETLQEKMESLEWTEAFDLAKDMLKNDEMSPSLQKELKKLLTTIEEEKDREEQVAGELKNIEKLIHHDDVEQASSKLNEIENKIQSNAFDSELEDLYQQLKVAETRLAEKARLEKEVERMRVEAEAKQHAAQANILKNNYRQKADNLESKIQREAKKLFAHDIAQGFYGQYYNEWDQLLNEVWGVLKDTMPKNEFEKLKSEQIAWIQMKEKNFAEIPDEPASSRAMGMDYLASVTAERTYYLIENYM
ncbi:lysozyme inhibitor LprI family protein [Siminovitchia sediminis]|uniref:Lysozyme inhibitor LprI family protein n=1 Tax=Siminovitchia sediminis TaxID=1274353 RepID=A0ABW4KKW1_9BACI